MPKLIKKGNTILFQDENDPTLERQRHNSEFDFTYYKSNVMIRLDGATLYNSSIASLLDEGGTPFSSSTLQTFVGDFNEGGGGGETPIIGAIKMYAGQTAPTNWHFCDGTELLIASHPDLSTVIGTTFGGDGVTTIALPDMTDRMPIGVSGTRVLGFTDGNETVTLTEAQLPAHNHAVGVSNVGGNTSDPTGAILAETGGTFDKEYDGTATVTGNANNAFIEDSGSGASVNIMNPYLALNYIIRVQ